MAGRQLSHYEILEPLGAGGMGEVFRARDTRLNREVAIKVLPTDRPFSQNARLRFQREAMTASALNHPNIITIYEINSENQTDFIAMELVRGSTFSSLLMRGGMSLHQVLRYGVQVADALTKAHGAGIIHRDLKPGNLMVTEDGLVKVLDFGLAKFDEALSDAPDAQQDRATEPQVPLSIPGMTSGTLCYMSPEQARGDAVDFRSDIFSFGIVMFQLLTRELPFNGPTQLKLLHNLHFTPPKDLSQLRPDVPKALAALIGQMLEKDVARRTQSMAVAAVELRRIARELDMSLSQEPALAPTLAPFAAPAVGTKPWHRKVWPWAAVAAVLVVGAWLGWKRMGKRPEAAAPGADFAMEESAPALYKAARKDLDHFDGAGNVERAIRRLERAVQLDPQSAASYAGLAEAYYYKSRSNPDPQWLKLGNDYARRATSIDPYLATGHVSLGLMQMQGGDSAGALTEFNRALELDPKSASAHMWLATLYGRTGKKAEANQELERAAALDPGDWRIDLNLGVNAYGATQYEQAVQWWEKARKLEPDSSMVLQNLSAAYHMLGRDDDSAAVLQHALEVRPTADVYNNLGTIRFYQGHYDEAVPAFEKTVALGANNFDNWANLGDAYRWSSQNKAKAPAAYQRAIQLVREEIGRHHDQLDLRADLAMYLAKSGDKAAARQELKAVEQAKSPEAGVLYLSAIVDELCGDRDAAIGALARAVKSGQSLEDIRNEPELVSLRADPRYALNVLSAAKSGAGKE